MGELLGWLRIHNFRKEQIDRMNDGPSAHTFLLCNRAEEYDHAGKLQIEGRTRDLAKFNLAIDSKLRGCDVVAVRVEDVAAGGYTADREIFRQKNTGRP
jgi:hypothetical protein